MWKDLKHYVLVSSGLLYQLKWCYKLSKNYKISFILFYGAELLLIASSLMFVIWSKRAIDFAVAGQKLNMMNSLYWSIAMIAIGIVFKLISTKSNEIGKMRMLRDLQNEISITQMYGSWDYIKKWSTGDLQFRMQKDVNEVIQMITQVFPNFTLTIIRLVASLSVLWLMDKRLALIILVITPLLLLSKLYYKKFRELNKSLKSKEGTLSHIINENLKFRMLIRTLGIEHERLSKMNSTQADILLLKTNVLNFSILSQSIVKVIGSGGFLLTFVWGVVGLHAGTISFGTMTAFLQLVGRVQGPMLGLLSFLPSFVSFRVSLERVHEVVESVKDIILIPHQATEDFQMLEISNLSFRYDDKNVLEDVNLKLVKGESTAIVGASGRGKTTLIRLLLSVIKPQKGEIKLHLAHNIVELSPKYRSSFGYVPQGDKLFSATIRENLLLGDMHISEDKIHTALFNSCSEFVYDLPDGLDTLVGESGYGLSEGQAQRIAIARTLLRNSSIWLFDEVTSSLDKDTSIRLMERLKILSKDKIFVFVTHDLHLAACCSHKYYMN